MSEEREPEQAGAAVEPAEITESQVLAAVERASGVDASTVPDASTASEQVVDAQPMNGEDRVAPVVEPPSAAAGETPTQIFGAAQGGQSASQPGSGTVPPGQNLGPAATAPAAGEPVVAARVEQQAPAQPLGAQPLGASPLGAPPQPAQQWQPNYQGEPYPAPGTAVLPPVQDGEIRINADHPMAALYMQSPMPPDTKGNRGAGVLIALLATVAFAIVYAGVIALWLAPALPPSRFLNEGLLPWVVSWSFIGATVGFFVGLALLVLIVGRAGWWAYVLGGLFVAVFVWAVALAGFSLDVYFAGGRITANPFEIVQEFGLFLPVIAAAIVAREVTVWFGAWIGSRGRKVSRQNAEALAEYEAALAEAQGR